MYNMLKFLKELFILIGVVYGILILLVNFIFIILEVTKLI